MRLKQRPAPRGVALGAGARQHARQNAKLVLCKQRGQRGIDVINAAKLVSLLRIAPFFCNAGAGQIGLHRIDGLIDFHVAPQSKWRAGHRGSQGLATAIAANAAHAVNLHALADFVQHGSDSLGGRQQAAENKNARMQAGAAGM